MCNFCVAIDPTPLGFRNNPLQKLQQPFLKLVRCPRFDSCAPAHLKLAPFPTRSLLPHSFTFYVAFPVSSIRPLGLPIYVARLPAAPFSLIPRRLASMSLIPFAPSNSVVAHTPSLLPRSFTFYVAQHSLQAGDVMASTKRGESNDSHSAIRGSRIAPHSPGVEINV
jgi:hypothetical protein